MVSHGIERKDAMAGGGTRKGCVSCIQKKAVAYKKSSPYNNQTRRKKHMTPNEW